MDATDLSILRQLMRDGRATWADLAVDLGLTAPAIAQRVRRLQDRGIIRHFGVWLENRRPGARLGLRRPVGGRTGWPRRLSTRPRTSTRSRSATR
jgi:DNA-binding Lrp family transcriptional regulator